MGATLGLFPPCFTHFLCYRHSHSEHSVYCTKQKGWKWGEASETLISGINVREHKKTHSRQIAFQCTIFKNKNECKDSIDEQKFKNFK